MHQARFEALYLIFTILLRGSTIVSTSHVRKLKAGTYVRLQLLVVEVGFEHRPLAQPTLSLCAHCSLSRAGCLFIPLSKTQAQMTFVYSAVALQFGCQCGIQEAP